MNVGGSSGVTAASNSLALTHWLGALSLFRTAAVHSRKLGAAKLFLLNYSFLILIIYSFIPIKSLEKQDEENLQYLLLS